MNIKLELTREQAILLLSFFDLSFTIAHNKDNDIPDKITLVHLIHEYFTDEPENDVCRGLGLKMHELKLEVMDEANLILYKMQGDINGQLKS